MAEAPSKKRKVKLSKPPKEAGQALKAPPEKQPEPEAPAEEPEAEGADESTDTDEPTKVKPDEDASVSNDRTSVVRSPNLKLDESKLSKRLTDDGKTHRGYVVRYMEKDDEGNPLAPSTMVACQKGCERVMRSVLVDELGYAESDLREGRIDLYRDECSIHPYLSDEDNKPENAEEGEDSKSEQPCDECGDVHALSDLTEALSLGEAQGTAPPKLCDDCWEEFASIVDADVD